MIINHIHEPDFCFISTSNFQLPSYVFSLSLLVLGHKPESVLYALCVERVMP